MSVVVVATIIIPVEADSRVKRMGIGLGYLLLATPEETSGYAIVTPGNRCLCGYL
jgi:hypothetical protein